MPPSTVVTRIRLYPLNCTLYLCTLTHWQLQALVALSFAFVSEVFIPILQCALHWLQLNKRFSLTIPLRNPQIFFFVFLCWKLAVATTALNFEHVNFIARIFVSFFCAVRPWADIQPSTYFCIRFLIFNPVRLSYIVRVSFQSTYQKIPILLLP